MYADSINTENVYNTGLWINILTDISGNFYIDKCIEIKYPLPITITIANSVSENIIVGAYLNKENRTKALQSKIV